MVYLTSYHVIYGVVAVGCILFPAVQTASVAHNPDAEHPAHLSRNLTTFDSQKRDFPYLKKLDNVRSFRQLIASASGYVGYLTKR